MAFNTLFRPFKYNIKWDYLSRLSLLTLLPFFSLSLFFLSYPFFLSLFLLSYPFSLFFLSYPFFSLSFSLSVSLLSVSLSLTHNKSILRHHVNIADGSRPGKMKSITIVDFLICKKVTRAIPK
jgi:hypothetical protein